ncbi:MAG: DUF2608 domain-containing protein [Verrucomicrobia bacterium]|nr:DUF2608 domain-containing protein [Verrucomicrobiota bacterium]
MHVSEIAMTDVSPSLSFNPTKNQIVSISSISMIRERLLSLPRGSWVFIDLDETLWRHTGISVRSIPCGNDQYRCVGSSIYKLVEEEMVTLISELKNKGIHVLSITSRGSVSSTRAETFEHLKTLGVEFSRILPESVVMLKEHGLDTDAIYEDGVVFVSDFSKGPIILELLKRAGEFRISIPPEIALIDDLEENINSAKEALEGCLEYHIPFFGIHYTAEKHVVHKKASEGETPKLRNLILEMHRSISRSTY